MNEKRQVKALFAKVSTTEWGRKQGGGQNIPRCLSSREGDYSSCSNSIRIAS
jgi:hypothetical protein